METTKTIHGKEEAKQNRFFKIVFAGLIIIISLITSLFANAQKYNGKYLNNVDASGVIINGYDPVAFFTDNKPVKGDVKLQYNYEEATYYFASQEHLDIFKATPEKYKPQFGAWCAYAVSLGRTAPIDVNTFSIVDGRLVIQHNQRAVSGWNKDVTGNLKLADKYWPKVTANGGKQIKTAESNGLLIWIISGAVVILFLSWLGIRNRQRSRRTKMQTTTRDYTSMATSKM